jgi:hypothetical protein
MRIYLAGVCEAYRNEVEGRDLLVSFHEPHQSSLISKGWDVASWMLDSGAFSAWRLGTEIDLDKYMSFIDKNETRLDRYVALDVIPGQPGRMPTQDEAKTATERTMSNLSRMLDRGFRPMPVYHQGEPVAILEDYVRRGFDVIGLGATASRGRPELVDWLIPLFHRFPNQRFHGLAMTQRRVLEWLPFDSVDSTSWLNFAKYGLKGNEYLLKNKSAAFYRRLGVETILDIPRCPWDASPAVEGQLPMFDRSGEA